MGGMEILGILMKWLAATSLQAVVLVVVILAVQGLARGRLTARWRHAMWLLLVARLLLPWAPPSRWSVFNLFGPITRHETLRPQVKDPPNGAVEHLGAPAVHPAAIQPAAVEGFGNTHAGSAAQSIVSVSPAMETRLGATAPAWAASPGWENGFLSARLALLGFSGVWLAGALAVLGAALVQSVRLGAIVRRRRPVTDQATLELLEECKGRMGFRAWLVVVESPETRSPALLGFIRPRLLLPAGAIRTLGPERLRHVLLHELAHLKRRDIPLNWLIAFLQALHWFNPLVWLAFHRMRGDREMACDALALECLRPEETNDYGRTIVDLLDRFTQPRAMPGLAGILEGKTQIKRRITMIAQFKKSTLLGSSLAALLMLLIGGVTLTGAATNNGAQYVKAAFDRPFENDPGVLGRWDSVDLVANIDDFKPGVKQFLSPLYLRSLAFQEHGKTSGPWQWTKGFLWSGGDKVESKYMLKQIGGKPYLFIEWVNGDVLLRGCKPSWYVMEQGKGAPVAATFAPVKKWDRQFVNDPRLLGRWVTVDFVQHAEDFKPGERRWQGDFFIKGDAFLPGGKTESGLDWTQGYTWCEGDQAEGKYEIREMGGTPYLFLDFMNGDVLYRGAKPMKYVMKRANMPAEASQSALAQERAGAAGDRAAAAAGMIITDAKMAGDKQTAWKARFEAVKKELGRLKAQQELGVFSFDDYQQTAEKLKSIPPEAGQTYQEAIHLRLDIAREVAKVVKGRYDLGVSPGDMLAKAEAEVKIAQALCDGDRKAAARAELELAQTLLRSSQARFNAGVETRDKLIRAEAAVKMAQARLDGDKVAEARARIEVAKSILEISKGKFSAGVAQQAEVEQAEAELKASQDALARLSRDESMQKTGAAAPQLKIESFTLQPYEEGGLYTATVGIRNTGDAPAPQFVVKFYRNEAERNNPSHNNAGPIKPGESWHEMRMPFALKEGVNRISVVLDPKGEVRERAKQTHEAELTVTVKDGKLVGENLEIRDSDSKSMK